MTQLDQPEATATLSPDEQLKKRREELRLNALRDYNKVCNWGVLNSLKQNQGLTQAIVAKQLGGSSGDGSEGADMDPETLARYLDTVPFGPTNITIYEGGSPLQAESKPTVVPADNQKPVVTPPEVVAPQQPSSPAAGSGIPSWVTTAGLIAASAMGGGLVWKAADALINRPVTPPAVVAPESPEKPKEYEATLEWEIVGGDVTTELNAGGKAGAISGSSGQ